MELLANSVAALVGVLHVYFLVLEMFFWDKPLGMNVFGLTPEKAAMSKALAANQGLYNGFLAAGIFFGLYLGDAGRTLTIFMLACVVVAGIYGMTVSRKVVIVQALPAAIALGLMFAV